MKIAIIDADLIGRTKHRFPNLACMKISSYYKSLNNDVTLKTDYNNIEVFDKVFISKVFTDTPVPDDVLELPNIEYGGTGFYYDKAPKLPDVIEHCKPDYHLYDAYVNRQVSLGFKREKYKDYLQYSIGFLTRGCIRHCSFCINKLESSIKVYSPLECFLDDERGDDGKLVRPYIYLWDDNFLASDPDVWRSLLKQLIATKRPFQFRQGLDERMLAQSPYGEEMAQLLAKSKYHGDFIFAFDNWRDRELIEKALEKI